jgi:hypothetical protein
MADPCTTAASRVRSETASYARLLLRATRWVRATTRPRCSRPCGSSERRSPGRPINRPGPLEPATECATSAAQQDPGPSGGDVGSHAGQPRDVGSPRASVPCRSCPATPVQGNRPSLGAQRGSQRSIVQCRSPPPALVASARFAVRPAMWREQPTTTLMLAAAVAPRADGVCA